MDDLAGGEAHAATLLYVFQNAHGKEPFAFFAFRYATEILVEELLYRRYFLKLFVVLRHQALFVAVEPVAFAAIEEIHGLGIELFVMDGATHVNRAVTSMQMKRRLPDVSVSRSLWLLVPMNEA